MFQTHQNIDKLAVIVLLLYLQSTLLEGIPRKALCPIGFKVAYDSDGHSMCFRKKGPETFADKFNNCAGNLFTLKLFQSLNITPSNEAIWTDYKNIYDGGPFVDWSYTKDAGDPLETTYEVNRNSMYNDNEKLCVVIDPVLNFTAVRCDENHYRYCFVKIYLDPDDIKDNRQCLPLKNFDPDTAVSLSNSKDLQRSTYKFSSPIPTCLMQVVPKQGNQMRSTWRESRKACESRGGSLLNRGWRYSNYHIFSTNNDSLTYPLYPFGVRANAHLTLLQYDVDYDHASIPQSEWQFGGTMSNDTTLGAVLGNSWALVNSSYRFSYVICEKTIPLKHVNLKVSVDDNDKDKIILTVDDHSLRKGHIRCFTDSDSYYPQQVSVMGNYNKGLIVKPLKDGYYWCTHIDSLNFYINESNKFLHVKVKDDTENVYAVKVTALTHDYNLTNIDQLVPNDWKKKIETYVSYSTRYIKKYGPLNDSFNDYMWRDRSDLSGLDVKSAHVDIKQVYLNARSVLLHVKLHPEMQPVKPGQWDDIQIDYMRPVYFCEQKDPIPKRLTLGESKRASVCTIYKCVGNFNEGVQIIETYEQSCYTPRPTELSLTVGVDVSTTTEIGRLISTTAKDPEKTTRHQKLQRALNSSDSSEEDFNPVLDPTTTSGPQDITEPPISTTASEDILTEPTTEMELTTLPSSYATAFDIWTRPPRPPPISTTPTPVITIDPTYPTTTELPTTYKPLPPQQQLQQVLDQLNALINTTEPLMVTDIESTFIEVDGFLAERDDLDIPGDLLHLLDDLGAKIDLNGSSAASTIRGNVALLVADARPSAPVRGLRIAARDTDMFNETAFKIIRESINSSHLMADANEVVVQLPESLATTNRRISFVVFRNDRAFQSSHGLYSVNSKVLSVNIENITDFDRGEVIDIYLTPTVDPQRDQSRSCAYWKFLDDGSGLGYWSQDGCTFIRATSDGMLDTCRCDHLTHFAEVLIPRTVFPERDEIALEIISIVGCCLSIFGLIMVAVTALIFRSWRRDFSNKIWLQLCISIFILSISFLVILLARFEAYDVLCMLTGIILHFSVLSSFCWMLVAAVISYRKLVKVFTIDASHKLLRASAFAWGVPCAVVGILLSVAPHSYSGRFDEKNSTTAFCYPSGLARWLSVFAPIALMLLVNWTLFAIIVRSVFASRRNHPNRQVGSRHSGDRNEALRCASVSFFLVFLFGLPWFFGLFAMNLVMSYFFVLLSTFQGFILFLFLVLGNKKTRDLWLNKLKIKQTRKIPVTSSTYTNNRSTEANVNSRSGNKVETIEKKISKPRSLSSLDDSRFS